MLVKERVWLFFILELLMAICCLFFGYSPDSVNRLVIFTLILLCLIAGRLLMALLQAPPWLGWLAALACVIAVWAWGQDVFAPLAVILVFNVVAQRFDHRWALLVSLISALLLFLVFVQVAGSYLTLVGGLVMDFLGCLLTLQLGRLQRELKGKDEQVVAYERQLETQRATISAIERQGRLAERNRLAARIHDKVGHGMTGSILMLEAVQLQWDKDPQAALAGLSKATENLRDSLDGIRQELREERNLEERASLVRIAQVLQEFSDSHEGIHTELVTQGSSLDAIPQSVWSCIVECLMETLTNMLKHSNGTCFTVLISLQNRLVYVEFKDNGTGNAGAQEHLGGRQANRLVGQGMGLTGIEERVLLHGGKAFFSLGPQGFETRMTFALREKGE